MLSFRLTLCNHKKARDVLSSRGLAFGEVDAVMGIILKKSWSSHEKLGYFRAKNKNNQIILVILLR